MSELNRQKILHLAEQYRVLQPGQPRLGYALLGAILFDIALSVIDYLN